MELSIVIPCLNEAKTVGSCVSKALAFMAHADIHGEVIVADNGSTDNSVTLARSHGAHVVRIAQKGYGNALRGGIEAARGQYVIMGDADASYDFSRLEAFVSALRTGADLVMGNRFRGGISPRAMPALHRYVGNPVLSFIGRLLYRTHIGDFHCGLRGFVRQRMLDLHLNSTGMEFASEMVMKACMAGYTLQEIPTTLQPDGRDHPPHLSSWRDGWAHLKLLLSYAPDWLFLYPALLLITVSFVMFVLLLAGNFQVGAIGLGIHTLLYAGMGLCAGLGMLLYYLLVQRLVARRGWLLHSRVQPNQHSLLYNEDALLLTGGGLATVGVLAGMQALHIWSGHGFGSLLGFHDVTRWTAFSVFCLLVGFQLFSYALLLMVMDRID